MEKIKGFALTALCGANFYGQIGSIAVLKFPLSEDFGFSESVLGKIRNKIRGIGWGVPGGKFVWKYLLSVHNSKQPKAIFLF